MSFPSPLLHIPTRTTEEADFSEPFSEYIRVAFEQDSSKFKHEIAALNRLRQDVRGAGKDLTGRDILYRYYGQLELLDLRFPFDESHVHMSFSWKDSFTGEVCSQYSIAFEKASVVYNLAAICSSIAALQNRFEAEGLRIAFNYFQASAGLFSFINENFLHAPSVDMSRDSIKTLTELALAQAQECFLEKVTVVEKKKGNLASKLCAQLSFMYLNVLDGLCLESISGQFEKTWVELIRIKSKLFAALGHYHRHLQYEMDNQYGVSISHIMAAEIFIKEAHKLAEKFAYNYPNFNISSQSNETSTTGKNSSSSSTALLEVTKMDLKMITDKLVVAKRDNDMIYHDSIPPVDSLVPLDKLNAVKAIPFADLLQNGQADIPKIVGNDIFAKLIPLSVHESSSIYSEEKSKLYRHQQKIVKEADDEIDATLNSLNLFEIMERIKSLYNNPNGMSGEILSPEVMEWCVRVQENEMKTSKFLTDDLLNVINSLKPSIEEMLTEITTLLDEEQLDCENMRYMDSWTQEPSAILNSKIRDELKDHRELYQKAVPLDNPIIQDLEDSKNIIAILNRPVDKLNTYLVHCIVSAVPFNDNESLLDENAAKNDPKIGLLEEQISIEKIDSLIQHLRTLKKDRARILDTIKENIKKDDISSLLILNKNKEKQIFQSELTKYAELQTKVSSNIGSHKQFLVDLVTEFKKLATSSKALAIYNARIQEMLKIFQEWGVQYQRYKLAKDGLKKGRVFYTDLKSSMDELKSKVVKFYNQRGTERVHLEKKIEAELAESGQRAIKDQLQKLSVGSPAIPPGPQVPPKSFNPSPEILSQSRQANSPITGQQGWRTSIPPSVSGDNSPTSTSNPVANYPRATFEGARQFLTLGPQHNCNPESNEQEDVNMQRAHGENQQYSENYASNAASMPYVGHGHRLPDPNQYSSIGGEYSNQNNSGMGQVYRPVYNSLGLQEYRPPQSYAEYQPRAAPHVYHAASGNQNLDYRMNSTDTGLSYRSPIRSEMYSSRPEYPPQNSQGVRPYGTSANQLPQGYIAVNQNLVHNNRPPYGSSTPEYRTHRPTPAPEYQPHITIPPQGYGSNQVPESAPIYASQSGQGYPAYPPNPGYGHPYSNSRPPSGYNPNDRPPMPVYRPPMNVMYAQQVQPQYQRPPNPPNSQYNPNDRPPMPVYRPPMNVMYAQQGQPQYQRPPNSQYNPSQQNHNYSGQNRGGSLMD